MKTPKEKAKELVDKFAMYLRANLRYDEEANEEAKQCALIAVDEILNSRKEHLVQSIKFYEYWQEVKQEIDKL